MTNNINVTEGTGKTVATEDIGGFQYQQIKLIDGKAGSSSVLSFVNNGTAIPVSIMGTIGASIMGGSVTVIQGANAGFASRWPVILTNGSQSVNVTSTSMLSVTVDNTPNIGSVIGAVTLYAQTGSFTSGVTSVITGTTAVSVLAAAGASLRNYITHITVTNAATAATIVDIKDTGANILYTGYAAASGGGFAAAFPVPIRQPNTNASIDVVSRTQASILASASGFKGA